MEVRSQAQPAAADMNEGAALSADAQGCTVHEGLRNLVLLLPRVMRGIRGRSTSSRPVGSVVLGSRHGSVLSLIREDERTMGSLAAAVDLNLATVSSLVADLERVGFACRGADPADRRRIIVRLAPGAGPGVDDWLQGVTAPIVRALQRLSPQERSAFVKGLEILEAELNAATPRCPEEGREHRPDCR